jgi:hypothetical protein
MNVLPSSAWRDLLGLVCLTVVLLGLGTLRAVPHQLVPADSPTFERALVRFHALETNPTDTYRWSQPQAALFLHGFEGRPAVVTLRLAAPRPPDHAPATVQVWVGDQVVGDLQLAGDWRRYSLLSPTRAAGETALRFETNPFTSASDPRELGFALSLAMTHPADAPRLPLVRAIFLLSLPVLAWLLALRLRQSRRVALIAGVALALVAGWAAAWPTAAGYWLPTLGWPWWPALPLLLLALAPWWLPWLHTTRAFCAAHPRWAYTALLGALLALIGMRFGLQVPLGLTLLLAGTWAGLSLGLAPADLSGPEPGLRGLPLALALLGLTGLALALRLIDLDGQPAGLWRDESRHGLQALQIWYDPSYRPVYVAAGADLPALLFYLMAPVLGWLGPSPGSARLISALAGGLTPLALYWAAAPMLGQRSALVAALLLAWASWGLSMSRWAFPATLDHVLVLTALGLLWRGLAYAKADAPRRAGGLGMPWLAWLSLGAAGFAGGLACYAYHTGRVAPLALAVVAAIRLGTQATVWRRAAPGLLLAGLVGAITLLPLAQYIVQSTNDYNRRVGSVSVLSRTDLERRTPAGLLLDNLRRYALAFHVAGDPNGRHHQPQAPLLDPITGLFLALGLGLALHSAVQRPALGVPLALGMVYLIPAALSSDAPHAMRALGLLAPACMLAGRAMIALSQRFTPRIALLVLGSALSFSLLGNSWLYFGLMRTNPAVYAEFDLVETALGRMAQAPQRASDPALQAVAIYLPERISRSDTVRFLSWGTAMEPYRGQQLAGDGPALIVLPATASPAEQQAALAALGPGAQPLGPTAYTPTGTPLTLAFGRGAAAARLVQGEQ